MVERVTPPVHPRAPSTSASVGARDETSFPRILVVNCQAFNYASGPGITLSNLFRGWPADRLAAVHDDVLPTTDEVCRQYYLLGDAEARWTSAWARRAFLARRQKNVSVTMPAPEVVSAPSAGWRARLLETIRQRVNPRDLLLRYEVSDALRDWVKRFAPEVIYTQPANICFMSLALRLQQLTGARLAVHFMDDWPNRFRGWRGALWPQARRTREWLRRILAGADVRLAISRRMAEEYQRRYGYAFEYFHNPIRGPCRRYHTSARPRASCIRASSPRGINWRLCGRCAAAWNA